MRSCRIAALLGLGAVLLTGCFTYPCDSDVLQCEEGEAIAVDRTCEATEPLSIELIETDTLQAVDADAWPTVHHGIQGGIHFALGVRVRGLDPDHARVQVTLDAAECADADCVEMAVIAERTLNAEDDLLDPEEGDGAWLLQDVVVLLEREPSGPGEIELTVLDGCGRERLLVHPVAD